MACGATLKRSLEFDPLHGSPGRSPKRMCLSMISPTPLSKQLLPNNAAFCEAAQKFVNDQIAARLSPANVGSFHSQPLSMMNCSVQASAAWESSKVQSGAWEADMSQSADDCWASAVVPFNHQGAAVCESSSSTSMPVSASSSVADLSPTSVRPSASLTSLIVKKDAPLFTQKQVNFLCRKMLLDREETIRDKFDQVLNTKLAEQYESFLKFNHDQQRLRFDNSEASYVS